jgi:hypothetical protein
MGIFAATLIVCGASLATAGIPDLEESTAAAATTGEELSLFCLPNGLGDTFDFAWSVPASPSTPVQADATITLTLEDGGGFAIPNFPAEDLWLQWEDESALLKCTGGTIADFDTDALGQTTWNAALLVGGYANALLKVRVNGDPLVGSDIALSVNSADIDADNDVDIADVGLFATDFSAGVQYRSDFVTDKVLNIADVGKLATGLGASCP